MIYLWLTYYTYHLLITYLYFTYTWLINPYDSLIIYLFSLIVTYITYNVLMIYLWFTYDLLILLMMILIKINCLFYAAQRFEPCTLRIKACRLSNQTTRHPIILVAHIDLLKNENIYHKCSSGMNLHIIHLKTGNYLVYFWLLMISI